MKFTCGGRLAVELGITQFLSAGKDGLDPALPKHPEERPLHGVSATGVAHRGLFAEQRVDGTSQPREPIQDALLDRDDGRAIDSAVRWQRREALRVMLLHEVRRGPFNMGDRAKAPAP